MNEKNETKKYLLSDESFNLLKNVQEKVNEATDVIPSLRKLINMLVTKENLDILTKKLIDELR